MFTVVPIPPGVEGEHRNHRRTGEIDDPVLRNPGLRILRELRDPVGAGGAVDGDLEHQSYLGGRSSIRICVDEGPVDHDDVGDAHGERHRRHQDLHPAEHAQVAGKLIVELHRQRERHVVVRRSWSRRRNENPLADLHMDTVVLGEPHPFVEAEQVVGEGRDTHLDTPDRDPDWTPSVSHRSRAGLRNATSAV